MWVFYCGIGFASLAYFVCYSWYLENKIGKIQQDMKYHINSLSNYSYEVARIRILLTGKNFKRKVSIMLLDDMEEKLKKLNNRIKEDLEG